ncbi:MAG TPA: hypothetical protein DD490_22770 [Acidobacteria bacterium]|nr:hypothetical protein [Acidobacteriota bacterium]
MHRLRLSHPILLAVLLGAGLVSGCAKEEAEVEEGLAIAVGGQLEPCNPLSVRLWGEPAHYGYAGTAGQIIDLRVSSQTKGLDPYVRLFDPSEQEEAFDDDGGGNGDALVQKHQLARSGAYRVAIGTDEDRPGEVVVVLEHAGCAGVTMTTALPMETDFQTSEEPTEAKD